VSDRIPELSFHTDHTLLAYLGYEERHCRCEVRDDFFKTPWRRISGGFSSNKYATLLAEILHDIEQIATLTKGAIGLEPLRLERKRRANATHWIKSGITHGGYLRPLVRDGLVLAHANTLTVLTYDWMCGMDVRLTTLLSSLALSSRSMWMRLRQRHCPGIGEMSRSNHCRPQIFREFLVFAFLGFL